jgi:hypothetical protein
MLFSHLVAVIQQAYSERVTPPVNSVKDGQIPGEIHWRKSCQRLAAENELRSSKPVFVQFQITAKPAKSVKAGVEQAQSQRRQASEKRYHIAP